MATPLEEFVVTLGARVDEGSLARMQSGLQSVGKAVAQLHGALGELQRAMAGTGKGFTDLGDKPMRDLQETGRKTKNLVTDLGKQVSEWGRSLALTVGAFVGGLKLVASNYEQIYYAAQRTGASAQTLVGLGRAMESVGGRAGDAAAQMDHFKTTMVTSPGEEQYFTAIAARHLGEVEKLVPGAEGQLKTYLGVWQEIKGYWDSNQKWLAVGMAQQAFGVDPSQAQNILNNYDAFIAKLKQARGEAEGANETAKAAAEFNNALKDVVAELGRVWAGAMREIGPLLTPILKMVAGLLRIFNQILDKIPFGHTAVALVAASVAAKGLLAVLGAGGGGGLLAVLGAVVSQFGLVGKIAGALITNLPSLLGLIGKLPGLISLISTGVTALGAALGIGTGGATLLIGALVVGAYLIIKHWDSVKKFFSGLWDHLKGIFQPLFDVMTAPFKIAKDIIVGIWDLITGNITGAVESFRAVMGTLEDVLTAPFRAALAVAEQLIAAWRWITGQKAPQPVEQTHAPQEQARQRAQLALPPPLQGNEPGAAGRAAAIGAQRGGIVPVAAHPGEMILPKNISEGLQRLYSKAQPMAEDLGRTMSKALQPVQNALADLGKKLPTAQQTRDAVAGPTKRLTDWVADGSKVVVRNVREFGKSFDEAFKRMASGQAAAPQPAAAGEAAPAAGAAAEAQGPPAATPVQLESGRPSLATLGPGGQAPGIPPLQGAAAQQIAGLRPGAPTSVGGAVAQPAPQGWAARLGGAVGGAAGAVAGAIRGTGTPSGGPSLGAMPAGATPEEKNTLALAMQYESKGENIPTKIKGSSAAGYYQIVAKTWKEFAPKAGVTATTPTEASFEDQSKVALQILRTQGPKAWVHPGFQAALARGDKADIPGEAVAQVGFGTERPGPGARPGEIAKGGGGRVPFPVVGQSGQGGGKVQTTSPPSGVDPDLFAATAAGMEASLPEGYTAKVTSGLRKGDPRYHGRGQALDWQIFDEQGKPVPNRGADSSGLYRKAYVHSMANMMAANPEKAAQMGWGGHFVIPDTQTADLMHYDLGGQRGRLGSSKEFAQERQQATQLAQAMQAPQPVMQAQRGGVIPAGVPGGIQALLAHAGEMILPAELSRGLQSLIGAVGGMGGPGFAGMAERIGSTRLGGDTVNNIGGARNLTINQTNTSNFNASQPSSVAKFRDVHDRAMGDLVRNFRAAMV